MYWYMSVLTTPRKKFRTSPVSAWDASQKCNCLQDTLAKGYDQIRPAWITWLRQFHWGATVLRRSSTWRSLFLSSLASHSTENTSKNKQEYFRLLQQPKKNAGNVRSWSHSSAIRNWKGGLLDCLLQVALGPVDLRMPLNYCWLGVCFKLPAILFTSVDHVHPSSMFPKIQASLFLSLLLETSPPIKFCPRFALYIFLYLQELSCVQMEERQKLRSSGPSQAAFSAEGNMEPAHPAEFCSSYSKITKNNV